MIGIDSLLLELVLIVLPVLAMLFVFQLFKQPSIVAYILVGVAIGPFGLSLISNPDIISILGELGVLILLFLIGMEISVPSIVKNWRIIILGTLFQIVGSVLFMGLLGLFFDWTLSRILLLGFVTSLSSTALILKYLESKGIVATNVGRDVIGVLVAQDLLIVPMLIIMSSFGGSFDMSILFLQLIGAALIGILIFVILKKKVSFPKIFDRIIHDDDYKLFFALTFCFGAALLTSHLHLSLGLGAFIGGMMAANLTGLEWVRGELNSFKTLFVGLFFISIGLLIDIPFLLENILPIAVILVSVFIINTLINASVFLWLRRPWGYSLYAGALLAPIGEFSFLLASVGLQIGAIMTYAYQISVIVIALSLMLSPMWTWLFSRYEKASISF